MDLQYVRVKLFGGEAINKYFCRTYPNMRKWVRWDRKVKKPPAC